MHNINLLVEYILSVVTQCIYSHELKYTFFSVLHLLIDSL